MNQKFNFHSIFPIGIGLILLHNVILIVTGVVLTEDSVQYLYTAETFPYPRHLIDNQYYTFQPFVYPVFLKLLLLVGEENFGFLVKISNALLYLISIIYSFKIINLISRNDRISYLIKFLIVTNFEWLRTFAFLWSETLFNPLLIFCIYLLFRYKERGDLITLYSYFLVSALLPTIRYLGVLIFPFNFIVLLFVLIQKRVMYKPAFFFLLSFLPLTCILFVNYLNAGNFTGSERGVGRYSFFYNFFLSSYYLLTTFPLFVKQFLILLKQHTVLILSLSGILIIVAVIRIKRMKFRFSIEKHAFHIYMLSILILFYIGLLAFSATATAFDSINVRFVAPIIIPVFLLVYYLIIPYKINRLVIGCVYLMSVGLFCYEIIHFYTVRNTYNPISSGLLYKAYNSHEDIFKSVKQDVIKKQTRIFTNDPYRMMLYNDISSSFLPEKKYRNSPTMKYSPFQVDSMINKQDSYIIIYEPEEYYDKRFYPMEIYLKGKTPILTDDSLLVFKNF